MIRGRPPGRFIIADRLTVTVKRADGIGFGSVVHNTGIKLLGSRHIACETSPIAGTRLIVHTIGRCTLDRVPLDVDTVLVRSQARDLRRIHLIGDLPPIRVIVADDLVLFVDRTDRITFGFVIQNSVIPHFGATHISFDASP